MLQSFYPLREILAAQRQNFIPAVATQPRSRLALTYVNMLDYTRRRLATCCESVKSDWWEPDSAGHPEFIKASEPRLASLWVTVLSLNIGAWLAGGLF